MNPLRINLNEDAIQDLKDYATYIELDNPDAAERFIQAADRTFAALALNPFLGPARTFRNRQLGGLRSWRIAGFENYLVFYQVNKSSLEIVRVLHGAMDMGKEFE